MDKNLFYNGNKLINQKDINGNTPEIFAVDGNRSDGKTTFFARKMVRDFIEKDKKFMIIKRYKYQIYKTHQVFFALVGPHWFSKYEMTAEKGQDGMFMNLYLNDKHCGYVCDLNSADKLKEYSQFYCDTSNMFMDEFQAREYVPNEVEKFATLHASAARGFGTPTRYLPVYMMCNHVSSLNPYYKLWKCGAQVDGMIKGFYKGDGFVIERDFNERVAELQRQSAFNSAFSGTSIVDHIVNNRSFIDNFSFVEKLKTSKFDYICNIIVDGEYISLVRPSDINGVHYYFSDSVNKNCRTNFTIFSNDHGTDTLLLSRNIDFLNSIRNQFDHGYMRFSSLEVKEKAFAFMSIML